MVALCRVCCEEYPSQSPGTRCSVCGNILVLSERALNSSLPTGEILASDWLSSWRSLFTGIEEDPATIERFGELLGVVGRREYEQMLRSRSAAPALSESLLDSIGDLIVDCERTVLRPCILSVGPLRCLAVLASFSLPLGDSDTLISSSMVLADPIDVRTPLKNSSLCNNKIVLCSRGSVTFATKVTRCQESGASAIIIGQNNGKWPFLVTDSAGELKGHSSVPVVMISEQDAAYCTKYIGSQTNNSKPAELRIGVEEEDCSVCQERYAEGESVLRLTCRHLFHRQCLSKWLEQHSRCPLCRVEVESLSTNKPTNKKGQSSLEMFS